MILGDHQRLQCQALHGSWRKLEGGEGRVMGGQGGVIGNMMITSTVVVMQLQGG